MPTQQLGRPCWTREGIEKAISSIAQLDGSRTHYFLACHSPMMDLQDVRTRASLDEERCYRRILEDTARETLTLVQGDPGTGKSHFIHWLKLRTANALESGELRDVLPVLIQRRAGTLKDALEQLISQLPTEFEGYLRPVRQAVEKLSETTARETLAVKLHIELGDNWEARGNTPLPKRWRHLRELCVSTGFRQWLCRPGGVIDKNIKGMTEARVVGGEETEAVILFTPDEFRIAPDHYKENTPQVRNMADEFIETSEEREQAAKLFNEALPNAIREMTGLSGSTLRTVFDKIRADLGGKRLALFIEDISVLSSLDTDVINAVEPQGRADLCPMTAVLGVTKNGAARLPENIRQRISNLFSVGQDEEGKWYERGAVIDTFAARYLNAVRLNEDEVRRVSRERKDGGDVALSACEECEARGECHAVFGTVSLGDIQIGTFPFTPGAPGRLLGGLDEKMDGVRRNPRGLLTHILKPVLEDMYSLDGSSFPTELLAVDLPQSSVWEPFAEKYCGGWTRRDKERLNRFLRGWLEVGGVDDAARRLTPFLEPLRFQKLAKGSPPLPSKGDDPTPRSPDQIKLTTVTVSPDTAATNEMARYRLDLEKWMAGGLLKRHADYRDLLLKLLATSLPWVDTRGVPPAEYRNFIRNKGYVSIDGMNVTARQDVFFFPRAEETRDLLLALCSYKVLGKNSWNFEHSELWKRKVSIWLRKHGGETMDRLLPRGLDPEKPVALAVRFLSLSMSLMRRRKLPQDAMELVESLLDPIGSEKPATLSAGWERLIESVKSMGSAMREFLLQELDVPQGMSGRTRFIDPLPILKHARDLTEPLGVEALSSEYARDYLKSRYEVFAGSWPYADLTESIEQERENLGEKLEYLHKILRATGYDASDAPAAMKTFCSDLLAMVETKKRIGLIVSKGPCDDLISSRLFAERAQAWGNALEDARRMFEDGTHSELATYDPKSLIEAGQALSYAEEHVRKVRKETDTIFEGISQDGDPDELAAELLDILGKIKACTDDSKGDAA